MRDKAAAVVFSLKKLKNDLTLKLVIAIIDIVVKEVGAKDAEKRGIKALGTETRIGHSVIDGNQCIIIQEKKLMNVKNS